MNDSDQIKQVVLAYVEAVKRMDMKALRGLCTPAMFRQFIFIARVVVKIGSFLMPKRFRDSVPENIEIEKQEDEKAVVSYRIAFGKRRHYERVVLLKENDQWKIDGKYV